MERSLRIAALMLCGVLLTSAFPGCTPGGDPVEGVAEDDPKMQQAMEDARANLNIFVDHLSAHPDDMSSLLKAPIDTGGQIEHIWIDSVTFDGDQFTGRLANRPQDRSQYQQGDQVSVPRATISDWTFLEGDALRGGYTVKVLEGRKTK